MKSLLIILLALLFSGCAINQRITYPLENITPSEDGSLSNMSLDIQLFEDIRKTDKSSEVLFTKGNRHVIGGQAECINSEKNYIDEPVVSQISHMIAAHINKKRIFKQVTFNQKEEANYILNGKLKKFYGEQGISREKAAASSFGVIGAIASAGIQTLGIIEIEFVDLVIYDKANNKEIQIDDIKHHFDGKLPSDLNCWIIYKNVNKELQISIEKLTKCIVDKLKKKVLN